MQDGQTRATLSSLLAGRTGRCVRRSRLCRRGACLSLDDFPSDKKRDLWRTIRASEVDDTGGVGGSREKKTPGGAGTHTGHTRDTHAHTRTHGSHRRTSQPSKPNEKPARPRDGRNSAAGLNSRKNTPVLYCVVRLCDPCARVRPCVPCVSRVCPGSPRCLFTGTVSRS